MTDDARDAARYRALRGNPERGTDFAPIIESDGDPSVGISGYVAVMYGWGLSVPPNFATLDELADYLLSDGTP